MRRGMVGSHLMTTTSHSDTHVGRLATLTALAEQYGRGESD